MPRAHSAPTLTNEARGAWRSSPGPRGDLGAGKPGSLSPAACTIPDPPEFGTKAVRKHRFQPGVRYLGARKRCPLSPGGFLLAPCHRNNFPPALPEPAAFEFSSKSMPLKKRLQQQVSGGGGCFRGRGLPAAPGGVLQAPRRPGAHRPRQLRGAGAGASGIPAGGSRGRAKSPFPSPPSEGKEPLREAERELPKYCLHLRRGAWLRPAPLGFNWKSFPYAPTPGSSGFNKCTQHPCCSGGALCPRF